MATIQHGSGWARQFRAMPLAAFAVLSGVSLFACGGVPAERDTSETATEVDVSEGDGIDTAEPEDTAEPPDAEAVHDLLPEVDASTGDAAAPRTVSLTLTLPPETPRAARLELAITDSNRTRAERFTVSGPTLVASLEVFGQATLDVSMVEPVVRVPVAESGADEGQGRIVLASEAETLAIVRWGDVGDAPNPLWVPIVAVPAFTPDGPIHVSGNQAVLGDWDGVGLTLWPALEGRFAAEVSLPANSTLEYKVTRGSWDTVEKGLGGVEIPNRTASLTGPLVRSNVEVLAWRDAEGPVVSGPRLVHVPSFASTYLTPRRDLWVYLPPGYDSSPDRRYPVLYMHDGQNLFDGSLAAFGVAWEVDEAADAGILAGLIEPLVIVGIESTADRMSEYTPVVDPGYGGGDAADYGRFLVEELKPYIDSTYRTKIGPDDTGLMGSSLGGLVSLYLGLEYPNVFRRIGAVSPSVWWADKEIIERVAALGAKLPLFVWLDIGTAEGSGSAVGNTRELRDTLVSEGWVLDQDLVYREVAGGQHNEASWAERVPEILEALFPASR